MLILSVIGMLIVLWGSIVAFVAAWFLSPPGYVVFLIVEWDAAKKSLWIILTGLGLFCIPILWGLVTQ